MASKIRDFLSNLAASKMNTYFPLNGEKFDSSKTYNAYRFAGSGDGTFVEMLSILNGIFDIAAIPIPEETRTVKNAIERIFKTKKDSKERKVAFSILFKLCEETEHLATLISMFVFMMTRPKCIPILNAMRTVWPLKDSLPETIGTIIAFIEKFQRENLFNEETEEYSAAVCGVFFKASLRSFELKFVCSDQKTKEE